MNSNYIIGLLVVLVSFSCTMRTSKNHTQAKQNPNQHLNWKGVQIKNGLGRGITFVDSLDIEYGHGHLRNTITNNSSVSMNLLLDLSEEYDLPAPYSDQKFKVIIWPQELTTDNEIPPDGISDKLLNFLAYRTDNYDTLNISIEPKEEYVITLGTLQQYPTSSYVSPNMLFVQNNGDVFPKCDNFINHDQLVDPSIALRLRIDFSDLGCSIISVGKISHETVD